MRFCATVEICNRVARVTGENYRTKPTKGVVQLFKEPPEPTGDLQIVFSTPKLAAIHKFSVKEIEAILKNFLHEGKVTVQLRRPEISFMIRNADVKNLTDFVQQLEESSGTKRQKELQQRKSLGVISSVNSCMGPGKRGMENEDREPKRSKQSVDEGPQEAQRKRPVVIDLTRKKEESERKKMEKLMEDSKKILKVTSREKYPRNGIPKNLQRIVTTGIGLKKIDVRILDLANLRILNLSSNLISSAEPLMKLKSELSELVLDGNPLRVISQDFFLSPALLSLTLVSLNNIQLSSLPRSILKLRKLHTLNLRENQLKAIPYNIHFLSSLNNLDLQDNKLDFLPFTFCRRPIQQMNISGNNWVTAGWQDKPRHKIQADSVPTLFELTAGIVSTTSHRDGRYTREQIPLEVYDALESTKYCCHCGRLSLRYTIKTSLRRESPANSLTRSSNQGFIPYKEIICESCASKNPKLL